MKKVICFLLVIVYLLAGCSITGNTNVAITQDESTVPPDPNALQGTIRESTYDGTAFVMKSGLKVYGFAITENTQVIWDDGQPEDTQRTTYYAGIEAIVIPGEETDPPELDHTIYGDSMDADVWMFAEKVTFVPDETGGIPTAAKPVIYLYPETETDVSVKLNYDGQLTCTYPAYENGWSVTAAPDGTLTDKKGQTYNYLYWEGKTDVQYDFSSGFCVAGADTAAFLEDALEKLGLNRREANEFIVYWLPLMEENPWNLISFQTDAYTDHAELNISPAPDTLIRVFMAWKPLTQAAEIPAQNLTAPARSGFTVIEWGGSQIE